jgi:hypothetical protein
VLHTSKTDRFDSERLSGLNSDKLKQSTRNFQLASAPLKRGDVEYEEMKRSTESKIEHHLILFLHLLPYLNGILSSLSNYRR